MRRVIHHHVFGTDRFGILAERFARFFGTPGFIIGQTIIVLIWIAINAAGVIFQWDPYPFILLNLAFSTQAAYAAPLILLAQTRQADRDKAQAELDSAHREQIAKDHAVMLGQLNDLLVQNTKLTEEVHARLEESGASTAARSPRSHTSSSPETA